MEGSSGLRAGQPDLGRAEEQRIDLVEVAVVALEDVVERRAVVARGRRGNLAQPARPARRRRRGWCSAPVRRTGCSRWCGRWPAGRSWRPAAAARCRCALTTRRTSKPSVSILCRPVSRMRAEICTPPARLAVGAIDEGELRRAASRAFCGHPRGDRRRSAASGPRAPARRARRLPRSPASRTARSLPGRGPGAGPIPSRRTCPPRWPTRRTGTPCTHRRMIGPDGHAGPRLARRSGPARTSMLPEPAHADLRRAQAPRRSLRRTSTPASITRAPFGERVGLHPQQRRMLVHAVRDLRGELVHAEASVTYAVHTRISPLPSSARSPL